MLEKMLRSKKNHYIIKKDSSGKKFITTNTDSNINIYIEKGLVVNENNLSNYSKYTMFLDGVFDGSPFIDNENMIYSLDHHKGVVRSFTLSTCEQVLILFLKGLDLANHNWKIFGNQPDLDTIITFWLILNFKEIFQKNHDSLHDIIRFVRVEGLIDSHGLSVFNFLGYSEDILNSEIKKIEEISSDETKSKADVNWEKIDFLSHTINILDKLDALFLENKDKTDEIKIKELKRINIENDIIIFCDSPASIYEVELKLKEIYDKNLLCIFLKKDKNLYTIKLANEFSGKNLLPLYEKLNMKDKSATEGNLWGGSDIIGGSPQKSKTSLNIDQIANIAHEFFS